MVQGCHRDLAVHLSAWCRRNGHEMVAPHVVRKGTASIDRWRGAARAGDPAGGQVLAKADARWGLAARGALVEGGAPELTTADLDARPVVWSELAPRLYRQAASAQWDPWTEVDWGSRPDLQDDVENAVVQVMTSLVENEQAALLVPARHLGRLHPHYRETLQLLAVQVADEARHVEVFTRRALLCRDEMGSSPAAGRASLATLLEPRDLSVSLFLTGVLGEGTFLHLLAFLQRQAPDPVTASVCRLALGDESRHVAFAMSQVQERLAADPGFRHQLILAVERRHQTLAATGGLSEALLDALVILASPAWTPEGIGTGYEAVVDLRREMDTGRQRRLLHLGFSRSEGEHVSALHTPNFM